MKKHMDGGTHLFLDLVVKRQKSARALLTDEKFLRATCEAAALDAGATIIGSYWHSFGEGEGVTGVVLLAESHISVHTFPEAYFAAFDFFTCGKCEPLFALRKVLVSLPYLKYGFSKVPRSSKQCVQSASRKPRSK